MGTYLFQGLHKTSELTDFLEGELTHCRCSVHIYKSLSVSITVDREAMTNASFPGSSPSPSGQSSVLCEIATDCHKSDELWDWQFGMPQVGGLVTQLIIKTGTKVGSNGP